MFQEEGRIFTILTVDSSVLSNFLLKHRNHNLIFDDDEENKIIDDMEDFEMNDSEE